MEKYGVDAANLVTVGYGKGQAEACGEPALVREPPRADRQCSLVMVLGVR